ncbi:MAG: hypothetical protein HY744_07935 [Deltaproteobacteria bacterium]|nr:hypothetical protein [Deltaproteobacteria bacterium]
MACAQAKECLSGFCVDGYCCNEICNGFCKACSAAKSGGQNGTCAFIPGGNPDNECPPGQQCDGQGACKVGCGVAPIPPGGACPGVCTGGCVDGGKTCAIDCFGGTCQNTTVNCPAGFACKVACQGPGACSGATINCPGIYACNITCQGIGPVCNNTTFNCSSGPCTLDCLMGAEPSCFGATLNCGSDACTANCDPPCGPPAVLCNQSCQCQDNCLPP